MTVILSVGLSHDYLLTSKQRIEQFIAKVVHVARLVKYLLFFYLNPETLTAFVELFLVAIQVSCPMFFASVNGICTGNFCYFFGSSKIFLKLFKYTHTLPWLCNALRFWSILAKSLFDQQLQVVCSTEVVQAVPIMQ